MDTFISSPNPWVLSICGGTIAAILSGLVLNWLAHVRANRSAKKIEQSPKPTTNTDRPVGESNFVAIGVIISFAIGLIGTFLTMFYGGFSDNYLNPICGVSILILVIVIAFINIREGW